MFYFKELLFRVKYFFFSIVLLFIVCFNYKHLLLLIVCYSVLTINSLEKPYSLDSFIYTHPFELLIVHLFMVLYFSLFFVVLYLLWFILDFIRGSLKRFELKIVTSILNFAQMVTIVIHTFSFYFVLPIIWKIFIEFNYTLNKEEIFTFSLNLKLYDFFLFLKEFTNLIYIFNVLVVFTYIFVAFKGIVPLISNRKILLTFCLILSTFLSPPDILSQILLFTIFLLTTEFIKISTLINIKTKKFCYLLRGLNPCLYRERVMS